MPVNAHGGARSGAGRPIIPVTPLPGLGPAGTHSLPKGERMITKYPGLERVSLSHPMGAPELLMLERLEWFAAEVMPAFTRRWGPPKSPP
jgi:hypothetical protein